MAMALVRFIMKSLKCCIMGNVIAFELKRACVTINQINLGGYQTKLLNDGWTVVTKDGRLSAQWEHTIAVTSSGYEILTLRSEEMHETNKSSWYCNHAQQKFWTFSIFISQKVIKIRTQY